MCLNLNSYYKETSNDLFGHKEMVPSIHTGVICFVRIKFPVLIVTVVFVEQNMSLSHQA